MNEPVQATTWFCRTRHLMVHAEPYGTAGHRGYSSCSTSRNRIVVYDQDAVNQWWAMYRRAGEDIGGLIPCRRCEKIENERSSACSGAGTTGTGTWARLAATLRRDWRSSSWGRRSR